MLSSLGISTKADMIEPRLRMPRFLVSFEVLLLPLERASGVGDKGDGDELKAALPPEPPEPPALGDALPPPLDEPLALPLDEALEAEPPEPPSASASASRR